MEEYSNYEQTIISLFNKLVTDEISAAIAYQRMANTSSSPKISEEIAKHADEEFGHFKKLIDYAYAHGFGSEITIATTPDVTENIPSDPSEILRIVQELETIAIEDYRQGALQAREAGDIETEEFLSDIMEDEQSHFDDLAKLYGGSRPLNFTDYVKSLGTSGF